MARAGARSLPRWIDAVPLALVLAGVACSQPAPSGRRAPPDVADATERTEETDTMKDAPLIRTRADVEAHDGDIVRVVGRYEISDISPRKIMKELPSGEIIKSSKVVRLDLADGTGVRLWVRPVDEMQLLGGKQAIARGKLVAAPPRAPDTVAQPDTAPTLVDVTDVAEYAGE
jgi:hypothetical protein